MEGQNEIKRFCISIGFSDGANDGVIRMGLGIATEVNN